MEKALACKGSNCVAQRKACTDWLLTAGAGPIHSWPRLLCTLAAGTSATGYSSTWRAGLAKHSLVLTVPR